MRTEDLMRVKLGRRSDPGLRIADFEIRRDERIRILDLAEIKCERIARAIIDKAPVSYDLVCG